MPQNPSMSHYEAHVVQAQKQRAEDRAIEQQAGSMLFYGLLTLALVLFVVVARQARSSLHGHFAATRP